MTSNSDNFWILSHKTDLMREILRIVAAEYVFYTTGVVDVSKTQALFIKFSDRYNITATKQQRYRNKIRGNANSILLFWLNGEQVHWFLFCTHGEGLVFQLESLENCTKKNSRLTLTGYVLVKTPRINAKAQWSWRIQKDNFLAIEGRIKNAIRNHNDDLLKQTMYSLQRTVGFSESRKQALTLYKFAKSEWQRSRQGDYPFPSLFVGWLGQYKIAEKLTITQAVKAVKKRQKGKKSNNIQYTE